MKYSVPVSLLVACLSQSSLQAETFYLKKEIVDLSDKSKKIKKLVGVEQSRDKGVVKIKKVKDGIVDYYNVDVENIEKVTIEDLEVGYFKSVMELKSTPDLQEVEWYMEQREKVIMPFMDNFSKSPNAPEVKKIDEMLLKEMELIKSGGLKLNGQLIEAKDRTASAYDVESLIQAKKFKEFKEARNYGSAVEEANKMAANFPKSKAYGKVVNEVPKMLRQYKAQLESMEKARQQSEANLEKLEEEQGKETFDRIKAAKMQEFERIESFNMKEKESGKVWLTPNRQSKESIQNLIDLIDKELKPAEERAAAYKEQDLGSLYRKAWTGTDLGEFNAAKSNIEELEAAGMNKAYLDILNDYYYEKKAEASEKELDEARGDDGKLDLFSAYLNTDAVIQDIIFEATDYVVTTKNEAAAEEARNNLRSFKARLVRMLEKRKGYEKLSPEEADKLGKEDIESLNAEMAQVIFPLISKYKKALQEIEKNEKVFNILKEPADELLAVIPDPRSFLTQSSVDSIKKNLMMQKEQIDSLDIKIYERLLADRVPEEPVISEDELSKLLYDADDAELIERLGKHCPQKFYLELLNSVQVVFNSYKGNSYAQLTYDEQLIRNDVAKEKTDRLLAGKNLKDVIHTAREIGDEQPWAKKTLSFKLKDAPENALVDLLASAEPVLMEKEKAMAAKEMSDKPKSFIAKNISGYTYSFGAEGLSKQDIDSDPEFFLIYVASSESREAKKTVASLVSYYNQSIAENPAVELIMASVDRDIQKLSNWASAEKFPWPIIVRGDAVKSTISSYATGDVPYYHLIDKDGISVAKNLADAKKIIDAR